MSFSEDEDTSPVSLESAIQPKLYAEKWVYELKIPPEAVWAKYNLDEDEVVSTTGHQEYYEARYRSLAQEGDTSDGPCPQGWEYVNGYCLYVSPVYLQERLSLTPEQARIYLDSLQDDQRLRNLFLTPASLLNDVSLTNMSDEALAALVFSQVFAEENWFKDFNWIYPYYNRGDDPTTAPYNALDGTNLFNGLQFSNLNENRSVPGGYSRNAYEGFGWTGLLGNLIRYLQEGATITSGIGFGLGNQPFRQAYEAGYWYLDYANNNPQAIVPRDLPSTALRFLRLSNPIIPFIRRSNESELLVELGDSGFSPLDTGFFNDAATSQFWNTMRFVWAGAAQREGQVLPTGDYNYFELINFSADTPYGHPGRPIQDVSAFSLFTTVFSGSVTVAPSISEFSDRNKAIWNIERLGQFHPENSRIVGEMGLQASPLTTAYDIAASPEDLEALRGGIDYDFLPYSREDAVRLVENIVAEAATDPNSDSYHILFRTSGYEWQHGTLLLEAYSFYQGQEELDKLLASVNAQDQ
jgi:hypothetical protein